MAAPMKTPGVYIVEKNAFPNSVVEVATAVPAFIGYTEKAENKSKSLKGKPFRISSMAEYHNYFGGAPKPAFEIVDLSTLEGEAANAEPDFIQTLPTGSDGADVVKKYSIKQTKGDFLLYRSMKLFFSNGGGPCWIVSVGNYVTGEGDDAAESEIKPNELIVGVESLIREQEPTMVVVPDTCRFDKADDAIKVQQQILAHCGGKMKNRIGILDVPHGFRDKNDGDPVGVFRNKLGTNFLNYGVAYYPWVETTIVQNDEISYKNFEQDPGGDDSGGDATRFEMLSGIIKVDLNKVHGVNADDEKNPLLKQVKAMDNSSPEEWAAEDKDESGEEDATDSAEAPTEALSAEDIAVKEGLLQSSLVQISPAFKQIMEETVRKMNVLPPAAAMAGVYTMVDNLRGVWKAPANVSLNAVIKPTVSITHDDQEDLNVHPQGKSINAIRSFIGEGTLVWGARTLDGNSLDWRYIQVRRTMIMLEESIRLAAKAYVFDNNDANTWITMKSMIRNFLTGIWKRGGLAGSSPDDAFSVMVGLGETMTPEDILEGILRVTVLVALIRPAEFIEITFQQQMQKS